MQHLRVDPAPAALTVCLWDTASTGATMPLPWSTGAYGPRSAVHGWSDDRIHTAYNGNSDALSMVDLAQNLALFRTLSVDPLPRHESSSPLLTIVSWWMERRGLQLTHGGAIGTERGGVLLAGKGGSGKSTTALACLVDPSAGLRYAGDDYCLVAPDAEPYVHSLYSSGKVNVDDIHRFPSLTAAAVRAGGADADKAIFFLHELLPDRLLTGFPLRAIVVPRVTGGPGTALRPVPASASLLALAPSTIFQLSGAGGPTLRHLAALARGVPAYVLDLGTDLADVPATIAGLLDRLAR